MTEHAQVEQVRTAEVIASLCLATDLGMGFPFEHGLHSTLTTMRLCAALDVDDATASRTYYACLLMYSGCTVQGGNKASVFGGSLTEHYQHRQFGSMRENLVGISGALSSPDVSWPRRAVEVAAGLPKALAFTATHLAALCEVAGMLAESFGLDDSISGMFPFLTERWDGSSLLRRAKADELPLPIRIIHVARDATYQRLMGDDDHVKEVIGSRAGASFDPHVARVFLDDAVDMLGPADPPESVWEDVLDAEPKPWLRLEGPGIERSLAAIGAFSELASPYLAGHSSGVAGLADEAATLHGFAPAEVRRIRRTALVQDVGKIAVSPRVWGRAAPLTADEREQVRLHPYHTERVLARSPFLAELAPLAMAHHERLDGSGYHRGVTAASLPPSARLLAAADAFQSKIEPRPYRDAFSPREATEILVDKAQEGAFDPEMVMAIAEAAGQAPPSIKRPSGLTEREVEVIGLLAQGMLTKQIATKLQISTKTADRHIQNCYRKIGVSTRAAATLFATENGLVRR